MDNGHGPVAQSAQMQHSITNIKLGIMIVLLIDLSALVKSSHITINEKDHFFCHILSPLWYHDAFSYHM